MSIHLVCHVCMALFANTLHTLSQTFWEILRFHLEYRKASRSIEHTPGSNSFTFMRTKYRISNLPYGRKHLYQAPCYGSVSSAGPCFTVVAEEIIEFYICIKFFTLLANKKCNFLMTPYVSWSVGLSIFHNFRKSGSTHLYIYSIFLLLLFFLFAFLLYWSLRALLPEWKDRKLQLQQYWRSKGNVMIIWDVFEFLSILSLK